MAIRFYDEAISEKFSRWIVDSKLKVLKPAETEELFNESIDTVKKINFSKLHVFPYSEREGTKSMEIPNHIRGDIKKQRARKMLEVSKELEINYMNKYLNKEVEILVEEYKDGYSYGHTGNYLYVKIIDKVRVKCYNIIINI